MAATERIESKHTAMQQRNLRFTYPIYKDMFDNNIIFAYKGIVTSDLVTSVLDVMEEKLEEDGQSRKNSKKIFNVMVECLTNLYKGEDIVDGYTYDSTSMLLVKKENSTYKVTTGNFMPTKKVGAMKAMIDKINGMNKEQLKTYYKEVLCLEEPSLSGFTDLAMIDLARKSSNKVTYQFKWENEHITFFTLESQISLNA